MTSAADRDLARLAGFLTGQSEQGARRAAKKIKTSIRSLARMPQRGAVVTDDLRALYVRFGASGYAIWFGIDGDTVTVARVFHMREDRSPA